MSVFSALVRQRRFVYLAIGLLSAAGIAAAFSLPSSIYPELKFPRISVVAQGTALGARQQLFSVTRPLEEAVSTVPGLQRVTSRSIRGASELSLFFAPSTDMVVANQLVQAQINETRPDLPAGVEIEAERMRGTKIDEKHEFQQERGAVISELKGGEDRPWELENKAILPLLFAKADPYSHPVIGQEKHVRAATAEIIKRHYDKWYHPNNAAVVICGGFDPDDAMATVKKLFGGIPRADLPKRPEPAKAPPRTKQVRKEFESKFDVARMLVGYNTVRVGDDEDYGTLAPKLAELGGDLLVESLDQLAAGTLEFADQDEAEVTYAEKITAADRRLDVTRPAVDLAATVRAASRRTKSRLGLAAGSASSISRKVICSTPAGTWVRPVRHRLTTASVPAGRSSRTDTPASHRPSSCGCRASARVPR